MQNGSPAEMFSDHILSNPLPFTSPHRAQGPRQYRHGAVAPDTVFGASMRVDILQSTIVLRFDPALEHRAPNTLNHTNLICGLNYA